MNKDDIRWFKQSFGPQITAACAGTPFTLDMVTAIACQETGYIWSQLRRKGMSADDVLKLCVGDTLDDTSGRRAFPRNKDELLAHPGGSEMFVVARSALVAMAKHVKGYAGAASNPNKFCHGFGLFQYDIQFFKVDPSYFLERRYERFDETLRKCLSELKNKLPRAGLQGRPALTHEEFCRVAIAYNTGGYRGERGLKQGHRDANGVYYGEHIANFLKLSAGVDPGKPAPKITAEAGTAGAVVAAGAAAAQQAHQAGMSAGKAIGIALMAVALAVVAYIVIKQIKRG